MSTKRSCCFAVVLSCTLSPAAVAFGPAAFAYTRSTKVSFKRSYRCAMSSVPPPAFAIADESIANNASIETQSDFVVVRNNVISTGAAETATADEAAESTSPAEERVLIPLNQLGSGQKIIGSVVEVNAYAAFLDCGVARSGAGGKTVPVHGFLHRSDLTVPYTLEGDASRSNQGGGSVCIQKGTHLAVYVKDVFKNSGRFTLTLDDAMDRRKASFLRQKKRDTVSKVRRSKRVTTSGNTKALIPGDEVTGVVTRVSEKGLLVDVGTVSLLKMPIRAIREARGGEFIENIRELTAPGQRVRGRVALATDAQNGQSKLRLDFLSFDTSSGSRESAAAAADAAAAAAASDTDFETADRETLAAADDSTDGDDSAEAASA